MQSGPGPGLAPSEECFVVQLNFEVSAVVFVVGMTSDFPGLEIDNILVLCASFYRCSSSTSSSILPKQDSKSKKQMQGFSHRGRSLGRQN